MKKIDYKIKRADTKTNYEIEKAIEFLVAKVSRSKKTTKPVIFHSIRMALYLYENCYHKDLVVAALLHDLLEDSDTKKNEITKKFGSKIAEIVEANSLKDKNNKDYEDLYNCLSQAGKNAWIVKCADILDNQYYFQLVKDKNKKKELIKKRKYFLVKSKPFIGDEIVWKDLVKELKDKTLEFLANPAFR